MVKNLLTGLWLPIQNCVQEPIRKNFPGVDRAQETGTDLLESTPLPRLSVLSGTYYGSFPVYRNGLPYPGNPLMETAIERYFSIYGNGK
jgi:hypothetical protein